MDVPTKRNSSHDLGRGHAEKHFHLLSVSWLIRSFCRLWVFPLSHTERLGHQTQLGCFLAPTQSVSRLFPAGQFHLAWKEPREACPCSTPPKALCFSPTQHFRSEFSSTGQRGARELPAVSQRSGIRSIAVILGLSPACLSSRCWESLPVVVAPEQPFSIRAPAVQHGRRFLVPRVSIPSLHEASWCYWLLSSIDLLTIFNLAEFWLASLFPHFPP